MVRRKRREPPCVEHVGESDQEGEERATAWVDFLPR
jgi:hypothetical protein